MVDERSGRPRRLILGASAQASAGVLIIVLLLTQTRPADDPDIGFIAWGAIGILAAIGLLVANRIAWWVSVAFCTLTGVLTGSFYVYGLATVSEESATSADTFLLVASGVIAFACGFSLWAMGAVGAVIGFFLSGWMRS